MTILKFIEHILYRQDAIDRMGEKRNEVFDNYDIAHAEILASVMIGMCDESDEVRIYSGALGENCYAEALRKTSAKIIKVLIDLDKDAPAQALAWVKETKAYKDGRLIINRLTQAQIKEHATAHGLDMPLGHFFCTTAGAYRDEKDHEKASADVNFHDPEKVEKLTALFDVWFPLGEPVFKTNVDSKD